MVDARAIVARRSSQLRSLADAKREEDVIKEYQKDSDKKSQNRSRQAKYEMLSCSLQGLRLGQRCLILCRYAGVAYQVHENGPFAI